MKAQHKAGGFTLLELMISLVILALIVVLVFGGFRLGVRAWEKGEREMEAQQRRRIVADLISRQLASLRPYEVRTEGKRLMLFKGDESSLIFSSQMPLSPEHPYGLVRVEYRTLDQGDGKGLAFFEEILALSEQEALLEEADEDEFQVLLEGLEEIRFAYLQEESGEESRRWVEEWDPEKDEGLPLGVRLTLVPQDMPPITLVIPLGAGEAVR